MAPKSKTEARGRPRSFNAEKALDLALKVFWRKGYEGASLSELTKAMGINRPSLYAAFGDKEALFRKALERYEEGPSGFLHHALDEPTARGMAERLLFGTATTACGENGNPGGCMLVQGALAAGDGAEPVRRELAAHRQAGLAAITERLRRAKKEGDLPADADPAALARYLMTVMNGMAVQSVSGATPANLRKVAETALRIWPV
jgi:AcrR family transcriptional regulator